MIVEGEPRSTLVFLKWFLIEYNIISHAGGAWPTARISVLWENLMHETSAFLSLKLKVGIKVLGSIIRIVPFIEPTAKNLES